MSYLTIAKGAAPATPATGKSSLYIDANGVVRVLDATGVDRILSNQDELNVLRNGGFWFAQRQAPGSATTYSSTAGRAISADGWGISNENASATYQRTDTAGAVEAGLSAQYYGNFLKITSTGKLSVTQVIESRDMMPLRGRSVRLQLKAKQLVGASPVICIALVQLTAAGTVDTIPATFISAHGANGVNPTLGTNLSFITPKSGVTPENATVVGSVAQATLTSAWQRIGVVFDVPTDAKNLVCMVFGNNQFAATNGFALAECTLTPGMEIAAYNPLPYELELRRVRRFYNKTFAIDTAPAQNAGTTTGAATCILGKAAAVAAAAIIQFRYPVEMRAAATTLTTYNPAAANAQIRQTNGTAADLSAVATANSTAQSVEVTGTGAATGAVGDQCMVHITADAEL